MDLSPATFEAVASRLVTSKSFEELVYRESEMDALFTIADVAVKEEERDLIAGGAPSAAGQGLRALRSLIFEAHDLTHDDRVVEAAAVLRQAAALAAQNQEGPWPTTT